jgi:RNA polymerase sigma-70 factor (ECF subfamily)
MRFPVTQLYMRITAAAGFEPAQAKPAVQPASVQEVYEAHFEFVWRSARRLGMRPPQLEDVVQEVFMVVQRRLPEFEGRSSVRTWLFSITRHTVRAYFRQNARRPLTLSEQSREAPDLTAPCPESQLQVREDAQLLHALLAELSDEQREVFVLAQLEELSGPEIAQALELPLRNVYGRIAAAQKAFEKALQRARARAGRAT